MKMQRQQWIDHKFNLGIDIGWTLNVLSRVEDTAIRIEHHCKSLNDIQLSKRINDDWSIKEHIGHLTDLEELWCERFQGFAQRMAELQSADMSNKKTKRSNHNEQTLNTLIYNFTREREKLLKLYGFLNAEAQNHQAMHPRIKKIMRPVDLLFFIAEHDDHHITTILQIKSQL